MLSVATTSSGTTGGNRMFVPTSTTNINPTASTNRNSVLIGAALPDGVGRSP
jgi:hypothetical protein